MKEVNYNIAGKLAKVAVFNPGESMPNNLDIHPIATHRCEQFASIYHGTNGHGVIEFEYFFARTNDFDGYAALWMTDHPDQADDNIGRLHLVGVVMQADDYIWGSYSADEEMLFNLLLFHAHLQHFKNSFEDLESAELEYSKDDDFHKAARLIFDAACSGKAGFPELPSLK